MKRIYTAPYLALAITLMVMGVSAEPDTHIANYDIVVSLDVAKKILHGKEVLTWTNTSNDVVRELRFHLYLNAFQNTQSTFMRESGGRLRGDAMSSDGWGWVGIDSLTVDGGKNLPAVFINPDDANTDDHTVMRIDLASPVRPHQSTIVRIVFTAQLPKIFARSGYHGDFILAGQWFPKIGVYEGGKGWNCHQYHANSEFFADFGAYSVQITAPQRFVIGATGVFQRETKNSDETKTVFYRADNVHDFAWTACPDYVDLTEHWNRVTIRLLLQPQHADQAGRHFQAAKTALAYFGAHVGPYPYATLTIVDPAYGASGAEGMEYPTFITAGTFQFLGTWLRLPEAVVVHEFGHQYFYGMLASNEFEDPWMDEGVNQYLETRIMDETYGAEHSFASLLGFTVGDAEFSRAMYVLMHNPKIAPLSAMAWKFPRRSYSSLVYGKTAAVLITLERMIGRTAMDSVLRTYYSRWRFRHPGPADFIAAVNAIAPRMTGGKFGPSFDWFFNQTLFGTDVCDYELTSIDVRRIASLAGVVGRKGEESLMQKHVDTVSIECYESVVSISRLGEIQIPVSILIRFDNGEEVREEWDGRSRITEFRDQRTAKVVWASVDPDEKLVIDINRINNARSAQPLQGAVWKYAVKMLFWIQQLLHVSLLLA